MTDLRLEQALTLLLPQVLVVARRAVIVSPGRLEVRAVGKADDDDACPIIGYLVSDEGDGTVIPETVAGVRHARCLTLVDGVTALLRLAGYEIEEASRR
jgi:hypothetical protein